MKLLNLLCILNTLSLVMALPLIPKTPNQLTPTTPSAITTYLPYILNRTASFIAQLPKRDDESKKHSQLLAGILTPIFILVAVILVLWFLHYKSQLYWKMMKVEKKKQEAPEQVVVVQAGERATV